MAYLNEVTLIGNVGKKPEIRTTQDGKKIARFSLATTRRWKGKDGKSQESTTWHRVVAFEPKSLLIEKYVGKGEILWLRGELRAAEFTDKDGTNFKVSDVVVKQIEFLSKKDSKASEDAAASGDQDEEFAEGDLSYEDAAA
jgi:single-strand DNA-binding protein